MKKPSVGISSYTFPFACGSRKQRVPDTLLGPVDVLKKAKEYGASVVQFGDNLPFETYSVEMLLEIREYADANNIRLEMGMRGMQRDRINTFIEIAKKTGANLIRGLIDAVAEGYYPSMEECAEEIRAILPKLIENDIYLGLENYELHPTKEYASLVEKIGDPHVGLVVDTTNSLGNEETTSQVLDNMLKHCISLHIKDYIIKRGNAGFGIAIVGVPLGSGRQDIAGAIKRAVNEARQDFSVIIESWLEDKDTIEETLCYEQDYAKDGVKYLKQCIEKL